MFMRILIGGLAIVVVSATSAQAAQGQPGQTRSAESTSAKLGSFSFVSNQVRDIQRQLHNAGYHPGDIDGIFGPDTSRAIIQYQRHYGLPQTGYPDAAFLDHLSKRPAVKPR